MGSLRTPWLAFITRFGGAIKLGHIELFVRDLPAAHRFYADVLGFPVVAIQAEAFVWLDAGGLEILLRTGTGRERSLRYQDAASALVLYTASLEAQAAALSACGVEFQEPDGGSGCLTFRDPDGHWFQLVDPSGHQ